MSCKDVFLSFFKCCKLMQSATLSVTLTLSDSQDLTFNNTFLKLTLILSAKKKEKKNNLRSPIHLEAVMYLWSHIQLQTYTHRVLAYYRTFLPEPIPTVRGMRLFVILLEKTASPHFNYGHHFIPPGLPGILWVFVRVLEGEGIGTML